MSVDDFEPWIGEVHQQHFDISLASQNLLALAANFQSVFIRPIGDSELEITVDSQSSRIFLLEHASGRLRMILARIGAFYMKDAAPKENALYGFKGTFEIKDDPGSVRRLTIETDNRRDFHLISRRVK
jgi:hypothetical protein